MLSSSLSADWDHPSNRSAEKLLQGAKDKQQKGKRRGGLIKSKGAEERFLDQMSLNWCLPIFILNTDLTNSYYFFTEVCITAGLTRNMTYENEVPDCNAKSRK